MTNKNKDNCTNILIPMAGKGSRFANAGYAFPKPLIEVNGRTMIEVVIENLKLKTPHKFIFICQRDHYEKYDLHNILKNATSNNFDVILINGITQGAACTALLAKKYINNEQELLIANSDQFIESNINEFIHGARNNNYDGYIMTFESSHPKWSYVRTVNKKVVEVAEKKVISRNATVGIYYYKHGSYFVYSAENMIYKNIRYGNEFYVCPVYNEMILNGKNIGIFEIPRKNMYGLGTPEDLHIYLNRHETT